MIRYLYQASAHVPPWAISYEWEFTGKRLHLYATVYSEEIGNVRNAAYFEASSPTPFGIATRIRQECEGRGITFTDEDFNQVEWHFARYW